MLKNLALCTASFALATSALAVDATFYVEQGMATWSQSSVKTGDADAVTATALTNMPNSLELGVTMGAFNVYLYPTMEGTPLTLGYVMLDGKLELDFTLGMTSNAVKDGDESSNSKYGLGAVWYQALPAGSLELGLSYAMGTQKDKTAAVGTTPESETEISGSDLLVDCAYVYPIGKNINYVGGISYGMSSAKEKDADDPTTTNTLSVNLLALRATF